MKNDYSMLLGRVYSLFGSKLKFAEAMGMSKTQVYSRFRNGGWTQSEVRKAMELLNLSLTEIGFYFYA